MIANARLDAGRFRPAADDAVCVLLEEGIGGKLAGLSAGAAEEIAVDVVGDAGVPQSLEPKRTLGPNLIFCFPSSSLIPVVLGVARSRLSLAICFSLKQ